MKQINKLLVLATILLIAVSCTTQRKRGEMSKLSEIWHNTNAHYNGYFNADEIIMLSELQLAEQHEDNYNKILDTYEYVEVENPQMVAEQLDEAIRKVTVVVNLHPYSQWSDDCYLLAGRALYLKQDYEGAEKAFRYLINEYPPEPKEERSTKAKKGKRSSGKNTSSRRTNTSRNDNDTAEEEKRPMTAREREKERKRYNREVRKRKKQRARNNNKKRRSSRSTTPKRDETPDPETPQPEPEPAPSPETPASDAPTKVRLSDNTSAAMESDAENYFMKHRPAYQDGLLWLGRTLIERDNYDGARRVLNQLSQNSATFSDVRREVAVAQAHLAIKEQDYEAAVPALEQAIDLANKRDRRARYAYILAQIHQQRGSSGAAYAAFERVLKFRPDYTMEFAARLNLAQNTYLSGKGSAAEAMANLEKMRKDEKNQNYLDQIYYAMAEIALAQNDRAEGIAYLEKSLANSLSNRAQKAEAYFRLGNLFFEDEEYLAAKLYFDSTLTVLSPADERYTSTERLRDNLVDIAMHIETIVLQDSLLMIAEMSPEEQAQLAQRIKDAQQKATAAATTNNDKFNPGGQGRAAMRGGRPSPTPALRNESNFWAYDDRVVKRGQREFSRRWGSRSLEDDWRRSNKRTGSALADVTDTGGSNLNLLTQDQIDEILADVPKDENGKETARLAIKQAMFQLGRLYRDRLQNNEKCVAILEELNTEYPGNIHELDSWYYLYIAHTDLGNSSQAKVYYDKILEKYPTSNYGQVLQDPNYAQEYLDEERQLARQYDQVYSLFQAGEYQNALGSAQANLSRIMGKHPLKPKYALLMAMCVGNTQGKEAYIAELQKVVATYPEAPEETRAKEILRLLGGAGAALPGNADEEQGDFKTGENELHYIIIVFDSDDINLNDNKIKVADYNRQYHSLDKLRISNVYLGESNDVPVLVLRRFKDKEEAMRYYNGVQTNMADFIDPNTIPYNIFPITQSNYREILRNRSVAGYQSFFESAY